MPNNPQFFAITQLQPSVNWQILIHFYQLSAKQPNCSTVILYSEPKTTKPPAGGSGMSSLP